MSVIALINFSPLYQQTTRTNQVLVTTEPRVTPERSANPVARAERDPLPVIVPAVERITI
jgi:hypothetical protein